MLRRRTRKTYTHAQDLGLLALRLTTGGLLAGHGAQKLFGAFGGYGLEGTAGWLESLGLKPGKTWAMLAGGGELGSGLLMALGLGGPLGAIASFGPMATAWVTVHAGKPIWVTSGGAELVLTNMVVATTLGLVGSGRYSLDEVLDIHVPTPVVVAAAVGVAAGVIVSLATREAPAPQQEETSGGQLQAGAEADANDADTARAPDEPQAREVGA